MSNKHIKSDLDQYLAQIKADNQLTTQRPYSSNLVHQVRQMAPQIGHKSRPIEIVDAGKKQNLAIPKKSMYFQNMVVFFPCASINLTKLRISILCKLIGENGGTTFTLADFEHEYFIRAVELGLGYIVVAKEVTLQNIIQVLSGLGLQATQQTIVNSEWITESMTSKQLLDYSRYQLWIVDKPTEIFQKSPIKEEPQQFVDQEVEEREFDIDYLMPDDDEKRLKYLKKRKKTLKMMFKQNRTLLDYNYDHTLANYHDSYDEEDDDFQILKKEEAIQEWVLTTPVQDEECFITDVRVAEKEKGLSLFEGIGLPRNVYLDLEDPLKSSQMKDQVVTQVAGLKKKALYWEQKKDRFVCEAGSSNVNQNEHIIKPLASLLKCYTNDKDKGRTIAYQRAIALIKSLRHEIKSEDDIKDMPTIGSKIKSKIVEILQTGRLGKADKLSSSSRNVCQDVFTQVWGVGPQTAAMFFFKGLRTLDDLRRHEHLLSRNQKLGLKYVEDFKARIPRSECERIIELIQHHIREMSDPPGLYEGVACGSFRRGKADCGDIDILITRMDGKNPKGFLSQLVHNLEGVLLTDHLVLPKDSSHGSNSYMGVGCLQPDLPHRRIDMKYYPREQFGTAVLYFTGSDHFNRSMRLFAQKKGYTLSDHGLYPALRAIRNQKIWKGELVACYREEDVFRVLNLSYKTPEERSV